MKYQQSTKMASIIPITEKCNQNCLYCSSHNRPEPSPIEIYQKIMDEKNKIIITGGETTLSEDIITYLKFAKKRNLTIELQSNGTTFAFNKIVDKLLPYIDLYNIAFPTNDNDTYDKLTQTKGLLPQKIEGIHNLIKNKANIRLTTVICRDNYKQLPKVAQYTIDNFKGISFIEFNFIKAVGLTKKNIDIVPTYKAVSPKLIEACKICNGNLDFQIDHIPICYLNGFEEYHVDIEKKINNVKDTYLSEKSHINNCKNCSLISLCYGPRKDHENVEVNPTTINPESIIKKWKQLP